MPQGPLRQILMPPPVQSGPPVQLDPTPLAQTNPGLARLVDFFGGLTGLKDALVPDSSNATVAGAGFGAALPLMGVLGSLKRVGNPITAYHGSPHDFDKFSLSKIGTGEGAQAYGPGLYFAEHPGVANQYAKQSAPVPTAINVDGQRLGFDEAVKKAFSPEVSKAVLDINGIQNQSDVWDGVAHRLNQLGHNAELKHGHTYEVGINAHPDDFLDWDKPLSQQSEKVRKALGPAMGPHADDMTGEDIYHRLSNYDEMVNVARALGADDALRRLQTLFPGKKASQYEAAIKASQRPDHGGAVAMQILLGKDIKGIRYLDQGSRTSGAGTSNYVVADDDIIEIKKKLALLLAAGAGTAAASQKDRK